ncbi:glycosyltransferase family 2 protein [Alphaproteobacteria bacterium]|nr:glycosyltransferase family 2 protein [Alphaproteobacteria bacterium]
MDTIKHRDKKISIIAPFFNEEESLPIFLEEVLNIVEKMSEYNFEIIFIDDGSTDNGLVFLKKMAIENKNIIVLELSRNFGKEAALTAGIDIAAGSAIIPIDVDLQDPPNLIGKMIKKWESGSDVVLAKRENRLNENFLKRISASFFYKIYSFFVGDSKISNVGDFRLIDKRVVDNIKNLKEKNRYMKGLLSWPGFSSTEILYTRNKRKAGKSKFTFLKLLNLGFEGVTSFSILPLKFFTFIGVIGVFFSFFFAIIIFLQKILYENFIEGYAFLILLILFFGSLQLLGIGILGEYIGKIYIETKNRPIYIIKNRYN